MTFGILHFLFVKLENFFQKVKETFEKFIEFPLLIFFLRAQLEKIQDNEYEVNECVV